MSDHHDHDDLDRDLNHAFERRGGSMSVHPPTIDDLVQRGQQRSRRVLAGATLAVLAVGAAGFVAIAGSGSETPAQDALPEPMDGVVVTTTDLDGAMTAWQCTGPLGTSPDGAVQYFENCASGSYLAGEFMPPTTTTMVPESINLPDCFVFDEADVTTTTNPDPCTVNYPAIPSPSTTHPDPTTTTSVVYSTTTLVPARIGASYYSVEVGDYPIGIAEKFCTTIAELVVLNGWATVEDFVVYPGAAIIVSRYEGAVPDSGTNCPDPFS